MIILQTIQAITIILLLLLLIIIIVIHIQIIIIIIVIAKSDSAAATGRSYVNMMLYDNVKLYIIPIMCYTNIILCDIILQDNINDNIKLYTIYSYNIIVIMMLYNNIKLMYPSIFNCVLLYRYYYMKYTNEQLLVTLRRGDGPMYNSIC